MHAGWSQAYCTSDKYAAVIITGPVSMSPIRGSSDAPTGTVTRDSVASGSSPPALFHSDFSFLFSMTMSLTTCPVSVIGHLSTLPLHTHYAIHLPFAFHAFTHPCFCPLLSTSLLLPSTLLLTSELNFCLSLLPPSILLIYSGRSSLKLILNISIFQCDFCYWMKRI